MDDRSRALDAAHRSAMAFLATLEERPVWPRATLEDMLVTFGGTQARAAGASVYPFYQEVAALRIDGSGQMVRVAHTRSVASGYRSEAHGSPSPEGAYLTYPLDDMLRILAIESERAQAIVVGEDLGAVVERQDR